MPPNPPLDDLVFALPAGAALFVPNAQAARVRAILVEEAQRKCEALALYEALPSQDGFHASECRIRLVRGSNRSGKTVCAAVEVARAVTGMDPHGKYPLTDGRWFAVGKNLDHVGQVMWRKLGMAGAFKIIRDETTQRWRAFRPWSPSDLAREREAKPAPPLLPPRLIKTIAWENKAKNIPKMVKLVNGWELNFYSSEAKPPQGSDINGCWLDEEICDPLWLSEMRMRILDRKGCIFWSATPQAGTEQLFRLHEIAVRDHQKLAEEREVEEFVALLIDNPHIDADEKKALIGDTAMSEEEYRVRVEGEFLFTSFKVYPNFSMERYGVDWFEIPRDWTRYLVVDPGYQVCAVLFAAVPPPLSGDHVYLYDELYLRDCTPALLAEHVRHKALGQSFQAFLIDRHGSVRTEPGVGKSLLEMYTEAFAQAGIKSRATGSGFLFASDDVKAGIMAVQAWLRDRPDKGPKLRVLRGVLKNFEREIKYYHYKREGSTVSDKPYQRNNHLVDCFDAETEVLTAGGWKRFAEVGMADRLATVNLETDDIEYQFPLELIERDHDGDMVRIGGHKMNALVTPNHRMVVYPKKGYAGYDDGRPVIKLAKDLTVWDTIKLHGVWRGCEVARDGKLRIEGSGGTSKYKTVDVDAGDFFEMLGWYVAEGSCMKKIKMPGHGYYVTISQRYGPKRDQLRELLARLPWRWNENKNGFYCSSKQLWKIVRPLGGTYTKYVPEMVKWASAEHIRRFIKGAVLGDGWFQGKRRTYATVSKRLADDMQELFIKIGRSASVRLVKAKAYCIHGRSGTNVRDQHWVSEWTLPRGGLRDKDNNPNFETVYYRGKVYCVTVPNGTLIVRREGKPMVAGNCARYLAMYNPAHVGPGAYKAPLAPALVAFRQMEQAKWAKLGSPYVRLGPGNLKIGA